MCILPGGSGNTFPFWAGIDHRPRLASWGRIAFCLLGALAAASAAGQGFTNTTGVAGDAAISGPGYFVVHDPEHDITAVTREGLFVVNATGKLVSAYGWNVQGYSDDTFTNFGDVTLIPSPNQDQSPVVSYNIQPDGKIEVELEDGAQLVTSQILLQNFLAPTRLTRFMQGLWLFTSAAGPLPQPLPPGSYALGALVAGEFESPIPSLALNIVQPPAPGIAQGILYPSPVQTDLGIEGNGFFVVRDPVANAFYATRAGACYRDASGYLINYAGMRLQGYLDQTLTQTGDIQITTNADNSSAALDAFDIDWTGVIYLTLSDGSVFTGGQILLVGCTQSNALTKTNFGLYPMTTNAGPWTALTEPGADGMGWVMAGADELSQFDQSILEARAKLTFPLQGALKPAPSNTGLAIAGNGFFTVKNPVTGQVFATRNGTFALDPTSHLVDTNGLRVQGENNGGPGDIVIDNNGAAQPMVCFNIDQQGTVLVTLADGSVITRGQILLQNYACLQTLGSASNLLYTNLTASGPLIPFPGGAPGSSGLGTIQSGYLELPNPVPPLQLLAANGIRVLISNFENTATVQSSTDLRTWTDAGQVDPSIMDDAEFFDTNPPVNGGRFYRVRLN